MSLSKSHLGVVAAGLLATAGLAGTAGASDPPVRVVGVPTATLAHDVGKNTVAVKFRTDRALERRESGGLKGGVRLDGHVASVSSRGKRSEHLYVAYVEDPQAKAGRGSQARIYTSQGNTPHYDLTITVRK